MIYYIQATKLDYDNYMWNKYSFINHNYYVVRDKKSILCSHYNFNVGDIVLQENNKLYRLS